MSVAVIAFPKIPLQGLIVIGLLLLIFIVRTFTSSARKKARSAVFQSMGFLEVLREQAFESPQMAARIVYDYPATRILSPVGKGSSALGETVIFECTLASGDTSFTYAVVGFRVPPSVPDFEIRHVLLLERFSKPPAPSDSAAPRMRGRIRIGPSGMEADVLGPAENRVAIEGNPDFAKKYVVKAADEALMRRMLTPSLMDALTVLNDSNLHIKKGKDWLFVFRWGGRPKPPKDYPGMLEEAAGLISRLDLRAASA